MAMPEIIYLTFLFVKDIVVTSVIVSLKEHLAKLAWIYFFMSFFELDLFGFQLTFIM